MMDKEILRCEAAHYRLLQDQLRHDYAGLDDETLTDTLEGLSSFPEVIAEIVRSALDDEALMVGLKARAEVMAARLSRLKERHQKKRSLAAWAMGAAGLAKLKECDFSVALSQGAFRLEVKDEAFVPETFFVPQPPKLDRAAVTAALKRGEKIEGAELVQGLAYITVSTR